jgi:hypothetical protein
LSSSGRTAQLGVEVEAGGVVVVVAVAAGEGEGAARWPPSAWASSCGAFTGSTYRW